MINASIYTAYICVPHVLACLYCRTASLEYMFPKTTVQSDTIPTSGTFCQKLFKPFQTHSQKTKDDEGI